MKNLNLILSFALIFFVLYADAAPRLRRRDGRTPKKSKGDANEKFKKSVLKYEKLREMKMNALKEEQHESYNSLNKRHYEFSKTDYDEMYNKMKWYREDNEYMEEDDNLFLRGKHDNSGRQLFGNNGRYLYNGRMGYNKSRKGNNGHSHKTGYKIPNYTYPFTKRVSTLRKTSSAVRTPSVQTPAKTIINTTARKVTTTKQLPVATNVPNNTSTNTNNNNNSATANTSTNTSGLQIKPGTKFQWQLYGCNNVDTSANADVFDIDLFETPVKKIEELKKMGKKVICYFSGGTVESWRSDAREYADKGVVLEEMEDWEDENWVDINSSKLKPLIQNRLDMAVQKGCQGVEIDNIDGYTFSENDFTYKDQIKFNTWLAEEAHKRNLSIGLKNDMGQIEELLPHFDWALNEECYEYGECELYKPFIKANKAVFGVSYLKNSDKIADACKKAKNLGLDYQIKSINLDASKIDCSTY